MKPTLHLVGLPHTETTDDFSWCAFTSLAKTFATMMTRQGYEVILYAGQKNEAECAEHVPCHPARSKKFFVPPWTQKYFAPMNKRVITEMRKRIKPGDLILLSMGVVQLPISNSFPENISIEIFSGYAGGTAPCKVYPSEAWRHQCLGWNVGKAGGDIHSCIGWASDVTIPHPLDPEMFPMGDGDGNYLLFIGRMGGLKGEGIAAQVSMATGIPLKVVGSGPPPALGEYLGIVKPQERARLMGAATAVLTPSQFPEPFCLVAVEAQMCGTPVLCTPWGAFTETVQDGKTGFRCYSVDEFSEAVQHIASLDRFYIRQRAIALYSTEAIAPQYDKYFARLPKIMKIPKHMDLCALHSDPTSNSWMPEKIPTHRS